MSRPARPRAVLDFITRPIFKGVAPAGNLKCVFTGKSGQNRKKIGRVIYASETIQNCKNPTRHIDTLKQHVPISEGTLTFFEKAKSGGIPTHLYCEGLYKPTRVFYFTLH